MVACTLVASVLLFTAGMAAPVSAGAERIAEIRRMVEADPLLAAINRDEALVEELRAAVLIPWERAWLRREAAGFAAIAEGDALRFDWDSAPRTLRRDRDGIREYSWECGGRTAEGPQAQSYLSGFREVEAFDLQAAKVVPGEDKAVLLVRYDLRGHAEAGVRRQDRGDLRLDLVRRKGTWKLTAIRPGPMESLESDSAAFEDATAAWGLDRLSVYDRKEAIRRGGYAIAFSDFDSDGLPDLLVGGWGPVRLFRNSEGRFVDVTEWAGLKGETLVKSAAFADLDNDGLRDLLLLRFVAEDQGGEGDFVAYRNAGKGRFVRAGGTMTRTRKYDRTMPLTLADFDLDGTLDLYLGFPGTKDFTTLGRGEQSLATQGVWLNNGRWDFREMGQKSGFYDGDNIYPHSAIATDLDRDGRPDLVVMSDRAGISPIYRSRAQGGFEEVSRRSGVVNESWAMTASAGDYDDDGYMDLAITNIDFSAGQRILASRAGRESGPEEKEALARLSRLLVGNRLFRNRGDGTFEETSDKAGIRWAGEASAGVEWLDFNNDGWQDLYVMNGLWSAGTQDISSLFVRLHAGSVDSISKTHSDRRKPAVEPLIRNALNSPLAQGDPSLEGPNPLLGILRSDSSLSMGGGARNRLFRNNGDGTFTDVAFLAGADREEDGYVAAVGDLEQDGHQDLVLRNGDPAPGGSHPVVVVLRNKGLGGRSLAVHVEGLRSNRDGLGAVVTAWIGPRKLTREVRGVAGASQGEPVAFFGLGKAGSVDRLEVRWPSGLKESFEGLQAGRVLLREGKGYKTLASAGR